MMKKAFAAVVGLFLFMPAAWGQQGIQQSGSVTPGHASRWISNGVLGDAGTAADSPITTFGVTSANAGAFCVSSGRSTAAGRQQLCFGAPSSGNAVISLQNYGAASAVSLDFVINGITYSFPSALSSITIGSTPIIGGSNGTCLYDNNGVVGEISCTSTAITQLTGDVSATGPGVAAATLATVNANIGTWGSAGQVPVFTVNAKGLITAASNVTLAAAAGDLSGTTLASNVIFSSLTSVGALSSGSLASGFTVVSGALGGTGVANTGKTITLGGNLTTSGAFASTFTMTGVTNVTFPTSGTLATTAGANVASVSNSDGTLTISPTTGAVIASLALGHANTWTAQQTFTNNLLAVLGSSTGYTAIGSANASGTNYIATLPANTGTLAMTNLAQSFTATQTLQTLLAGTTNTYDIGTSASVAAFRTIYAGTSFVGPLVNATTGYQVNGAATSGQYLRGNGTHFVSSAIQAADVPVVANALGAPSATFGVMKADGTTIQCTSGTCSAVGSVATAVTVGTTSINSATASNYFLTTGTVTAGTGVLANSAAGTGVLTALGVNTGSAGAFSVLIASGAKALATSAIASATCTSAQTDTATGTATTDAIIASFNGDPTAVTGYVPLVTGMLTIIAYPTANTVNFKVCNNTSASITPGAVTINWRVVR